MKIIDGKKIAWDLRNGVKDKIKKEGLRLKLCVIRVGEDPASKIYIGMKRKACEEVGIDFLEVFLDEKEVVDNYVEKKICLVSKKIEELNLDKSVTGILVQLPIPRVLAKEKIFELIDPRKDVDCLTPINIGRMVLGYGRVSPCTAKGCIELIKSTGISIEGKNAVVVGRSEIVGKPAALLLLQENATVSICHSKTRNLAEYTKKADILVAAAGVPKLIKEDMVKKDATVIDVGINRLQDKLAGDVDFVKVKNKAAFVTPVPGGVGPMTVAELINNVYLLGKNY
ncbi:MAG: bifunctional methylenetetrahydrofolate dehydrogenase/methenyltetrahydrofolate cyclohydrolase [Candidatus Moranbacteria bacterium]|nr:bifunctional methylenetetrahydrofolate dehydrogenase/methenyltetrahydrofolate cyclohydrolase [Candidatus Moranbacteria bacterium]